MKVYVEALEVAKVMIESVPATDDVSTSLKVPEEALDESAMNDNNTPQEVPVVPLEFSREESDSECFEVVLKQCVNDINVGIDDNTVSPEAKKDDVLDNFIGQIEEGTCEYVELLSTYQGDNFDEFPSKKKTIKRKTYIYKPSVPLLCDDKIRYVTC